MLKSLVSAVAVFILISTLFWGLTVAVPRYFGAFSTSGAQRFLDVILLAAATFAGVVSNAVYDRITSKKVSTNFLRTKDVILASVVAPIVMLPIYQTLRTTSDVVVLILTSYQNGFFFNTFFSKLTQQHKNES